MTWFVAVVVIAGVVMTGCYFAQRRVTVRELGTRGSILLPKRLETRNPLEESAYTLFPFERPSGSFLHMGSHTPMVERLVVGKWDEASREDVHNETVSGVQYRMPSKQIRWWQDGEYQIGEGSQEVNTYSFPAWIVARDAPDKKVTVAYMVWKKVSSLEAARALVDRALATFVPAK